jgi:hypothetical protein
MRAEMSNHALSRALAAESFGFIFDSTSDLQCSRACYCWISLVQNMGRSQSFVGVIHVCRYCKDTRPKDEIEVHNIIFKRLNILYSWTLQTNVFCFIYLTLLLFGFTWLLDMKKIMKSKESCFKNIIPHSKFHTKFEAIPFLQWIFLHFAQI